MNSTRSLLGSATIPAQPALSAMHVSHDWTALDQTFVGITSRQRRDSVNRSVDEFFGNKAKGHRLTIFMPIAKWPRPECDAGNSGRAARARLKSNPVFRMASNKSQYGFARIVAWQTPADPEARPLPNSNRSENKSFGDKAEGHRLTILSCVAEWSRPECDAADSGRLRDRVELRTARPSGTAFDQAPQGPGEHHGAAVPPRAAG